MHQARCAATGRTRVRPVHHEFKKVWLNLTAPSRSWTAFMDHATGRLSIDEESARMSFQSPDGESYVFDHIRDVTFGRAGSDSVNIWVSFRWGDGDDKRAYCTDGRLLGWRPMFSSSNRRIFEAIVSISEDRQDKAPRPDS